MKNTIFPFVSVVLPVYNCPEYIHDAIESILQQTFVDFELIVIDDGSTDNTADIIETFTDPRIRFYSQKNQGLAATLNRGLELSRGNYIARQDQDDISLPERFAKQVEYLESHLECGLVGTWAEIWRGEHRTGRKHLHPSDNITLKCELLFDNPFVHSSVMLRKSVLEHVGGYCIDPDRQPPEDYELWSRIARDYQIANIPELLLVYREIQNSMSRVGVTPFLNHLVTISSENIAWASNIPASVPSVVNIAAMVHNAGHRLIGEPDFPSMATVLQRAVSRISKNDSELVRKARYRIEDLRNAYWRKKHPGIVPTFFYYVFKAINILLRIFRI